jgi:hypothetical protein
MNVNTLLTPITKGDILVSTNKTSRKESNKMEDVISPEKVSVTKSYVITQAQANNIKEMGLFLTAQESKLIADSEVVRRAIDAYYLVVFPAVEVKG